MMPKIHTTKYRVAGVYLNIVLLAISLFMTFAMKIDSLRFWGAYGLFVSAVLFITYAVINEKIFTAFSLFFMAFCVFQFGQFYLYGLGVQYDYVFQHPFYSKFALEKHMWIVVKFTLLSIQVLMLAGVLVGVKERQFVLTEQTNTYHLKRIGKLLFWISMPASMIMTAMQVLFAVRYGYEALRIGNTATLLGSLGIFNRLSIFYTPSLILLWILNTNKKKTQIIYESLMIVHILAYLVIGQRTIGLGLAGTLMLMKMNNAKKMKFSTILIIISLGIGLMGLSNYLANARLAGGGDIGGSRSVMSGVINFIGSCGWSCFPLMVVVGASPDSMPFTHGVSYLASIMGFFPSFADPSGLLRTITDSVNESWLTTYTKATFGIGYSLTAEAYHNFSWFGIIAIFFIGVIVALILNCTKNKLSPFRYYVQMSMTYALFTLPRRGIYDLFNYLFYFVFVFWLLRKISIAIDAKKYVTE
ncbi:hypothetical protein HMPREF9430_01764 [Solobacterium moorei F0204]|uniref:O-antigen polysaccharide polymerase Wzy n=2 Tax=Solobacterium moorei TaxID=102148 RepID=E7MQD0_9FIRM|nr:hypothetical protein HMPREF9430_01764 [Solobacterium moorei F0204]